LAGIQGMKKGPFRGPLSCRTSTSTCFCPLDDLADRPVIPGPTSAIDALFRQLAPDLQEAPPFAVHREQDVNDLLLPGIFDYGGGLAL